MENFVIEDYGKKTTFASFLPGIAGIKGIPIWCYYVNRGQAVVSFGVDNKDHAIMEFYPAHTAYQNVKRTGFRTFIREKCKNEEARVTEIFADENKHHEMQVGANTLTIEENNAEAGLKTQVTYYVLPEERIGGLVRIVKIENTSNAERELEIIDGMPALIPYGVSLDSMKNMAQLSKAWMQVEEHIDNVPFYRVRASMEDTASVSTVAGGNFSFAIDEQGKRLECIVDPEVIFGYDNSLEKPVGFMVRDLDEVLSQKQNTSNLIPGSFFAKKAVLAPGESTCIYELIGQVEELSVLKTFIEKRDITPEFFEEKYARAQELTEKLTDAVATKTADKHFDDYTRYTFMDNVLRGGLPIKLGNNKVFYVYSRKHGDLEREYNYFAMSPEFYSQGNGNFRDVNQNRRLDSFFAPYTDRAGIKMFYSLIQTDGYNPLSIEKLAYSIDEDALEKILSEAQEDGTILNSIHEVVAGRHFTPGQLALVCEGQLFDKIMDESRADVNATLGEGYWSDHWTYNLDLVEEYLALYPEKEEELLFEQDYTYFASQKKINKRAERYEETPAGIRQYQALDEKSSGNAGNKLLCTREGNVYRGTLLEKLILLSTVKYAALDPEQMGIEMEGGKPGWYDALNGLPGIFGSSMAETYELERMLTSTIRFLEKTETEVALFKELYDFMKDVYKMSELACAGSANVQYWNQVNDRKEQYWEDVFESISGEVCQVPAAELRAILARFKEVVDAGIAEAVKLGNGMCPTYFYYDVTEYTKDEAGIHPVAFKLNMVPMFLEGPVRYMKLNLPQEEKRSLYAKVKNSNLYDSKLGMYKINEPLENASYELGRCRCFTPGWLENESIWLHMEYKYLLELLRSGLYSEYAADLHTALVPFMDPEIYGRSILENSSFIASSANPNEKIHGKGFVARLSGSTIEFMSMWKIMMFGEKPFMERGGELFFAPKPVMPSYLIPGSEDGEGHVVSARFMGQTDIRYHFQEKRDYFPGSYSIKKMTLTAKDGSVITCDGEHLKGTAAMDLRAGMYIAVDVFL